MTTSEPGTAAAGIDGAQVPWARHCHPRARLVGAMAHPLTHPSFREIATPRPVLPPLHFCSHYQPGGRNSASIAWDCKRSSSEDRNAKRSHFSSIKTRLMEMNSVIYMKWRPFGNEPAKPLSASLPGRYGGPIDSRFICSVTMDGHDHGRALTFSASGDTLPVSPLKEQPRR
jgi:hypothetical protein